MAIDKPKKKNDGGNSRQMIIIGVIAAAVVVAIAAIVISSSGAAITSSNINFDEIPQFRRDDGGFVLGDPDAPVTIVAFEDFLCPHCQTYKPTIDAFIEEYVATGQAQLEYRMMPAVDPTYSGVAASLAECAEILEPGSFWEAHNILFQIASSERFHDSNNSPQDFANAIDINYGELLRCVDDADQYRTDAQLAQSNGVTGTPTVLVRINNGPLQSGLVSLRPGIQELGAFVQRFQ